MTPVTTIHAPPIPVPPHHAGGPYVSEALYLADRVLLFDSLNGLRTSIDTLTGELTTFKVGVLPEMAVDRAREDREDRSDAKKKDRINAYVLMAASCLLSGAVGAFVVLLGIG